MAALWDVLRAEVRAKAGELREKGAATALKEAAAESRQAAATTGGWLWGNVKDLVAGSGPVPLIRASGIPATGAVVPVELPSGSVVEATVLEVDGRYCPLRARVELRGSSPDATAVCGEVLWAEIGGPASATDFEGATLSVRALPAPGASVRLELLKGGHAMATVMDVYFEEAPRARLSIPGASEVVSVPIHLLPPSRDVGEPTAIEAAAVVGEALRREVGGKVRELRDTAAVSAMSERAREGASKIGDTLSAMTGHGDSSYRNFDREPMRELIVNEDEATDSRALLLEEATDSRMPLLEETTDSRAPLLEEATDSRAPLLKEATDSRAPLLEEVTNSHVPLLQEATESRVPLLQAEAPSPTKDDDAPARVEAAELQVEDRAPPQIKAPKAEEQAPDFLE